jgi:transcriptional regulator, propionate catabolism operon regulatory protein
MESWIMKKRILLLAPYEGLKELALSVVEEYEDTFIQVYKGNYENGPHLLLELNGSQHYDAVITRGGTAEACRRVTTLPVIEIYINAFDIIRIMKLSEGYKGKKALLAYPSLVKSFTELGDLLGYSVPAYRYQVHKEVKGMVEQLKRDGYELLIGDPVVYHAAQELGMKSILLTSGTEGVRSAIEEAIRLCSALARTKDSGSVLLPDMDHPRAGSTYSDEAVSIVQGNELSPSLVYTVFPQEIMNQLMDWSHTPLPTVITGAEGMCKNDAGYLVCCYGASSRRRLIRVSCSSIPADYPYDELGQLVLEQLQDQGATLFLEDIEQLEQEGQQKLLQLVKGLSKDSRLKIITSCGLPVETAVSSGKMLRQLRTYLDEVRIELQPFKAYNQEIPNLLSIYLAKLDVRCATRVVGMRESGIGLLTEYEWPGNLRQFQRVINELVLSCKGSYIAESQVRHALRKETEVYNQMVLVPMDLSGSMKDIEARIIRQVLEEEGMNQARVEKRLGISHSSLWRKLK